jgi:hypothetical protein
MRITLATLLLLSLALAGCVVEPGGGYRDHGYQSGYQGGARTEFHAGYTERGN